MTMCTERDELNLNMGDMVDSYVCQMPFNLSVSCYT